MADSGSIDVLKDDYGDRWLIDPHNKLALSLDGISGQ